MIKKGETLFFKILPIFLELIHVVDELHPVLKGKLLIFRALHHFQCILLLPPFCKGVGKNLIVESVGGKSCSTRKDNHFSRFISHLKKMHFLFIEIENSYLQKYLFSWLNMNINENQSLLLK